MVLVNSFTLKKLIFPSKLKIGHFNVLQLIINELFVTVTSLISDQNPMFLFKGNFEDFKFVRILDNIDYQSNKCAQIYFSTRMNRLIFANVKYRSKIITKVSIDQGLTWRPIQGKFQDFECNFPDCYITLNLKCFDRYKVDHEFAGYVYIRLCVYLYLGSLFVDLCIDLY